MDTVLLSVLVVVVVLIIFLAALVIFRAMMYGRAPEPVESIIALAVQPDLVAEHLSTALRIQTVSTGEGDPTASASFEKLHAKFEKMYPRLHGVLKLETVNEHSLLYTWAGRNPELEPVMFCGHMDVVPADPSTLNEWTHPPFAGVVADGFVWGRGALDMKGTVISVLEAVESLIKTGYQPERTVYLAFGHDEEIGGLHGARAIAGLLAERGEKLAAVLDEGGAIMSGAIPGVPLPIALVGIAEKGYSSLLLKIEGRPGHSSMPPQHTAIGVLGRALTRIEANPMPARLSMARLMFEELGIFLPFANRLALGNTWLMGGVLLRKLAGSPTTNALIRTTAAVTLAQGGVKDNILPSQAQATVNCRLLPGDTRASLLAHYRKAVDDEAVQISLPEETSWEASPVSSIESPVFTSLSRTIRQVYPEVVVAPYLMAGASDSRHYIGLTGNIYRFSPDLMDNNLMHTIHGINERVSIESLGRKVQFYGQLIQTWTGEK